MQDLKIIFSFCLFIDIGCAIVCKSVPVRFNKK